MSLAVCDHFGWLCGLKARSHGAMCDWVFKIFPMRFSVSRFCSHNPFFKSQLHSQKLHRVNEPSRVVHMVRFFLNATAIFSEYDCNGLCVCQWYCSDDVTVMYFCVWCRTWTGSTPILCDYNVWRAIVMCDSKLHTCVSTNHNCTMWTISQKMHLKNTAAFTKDRTVWTSLQVLTFVAYCLFGQLHPQLPRSVWSDKRLNWMCGRQYRKGYLRCESLQLWLLEKLWFFCRRIEKAHK